MTALKVCKTMDSLSLASLRLLNCRWFPGPGAPPHTGVMPNASICCPPGTSPVPAGTPLSHSVLGSLRWEMEVQDKLMQPLTGALRRCACEVQRWQPEGILH